MEKSVSKSSSLSSPNAGMRMSSKALVGMRDTEKVMLRYYNDMGKNKGNCTWGIGFYVHKGVCSKEELERKVDVASVETEYAKRVAEAERRVRLKVNMPLDQAQFDALVSFTYNTRSATNQRVYDALNSGNVDRATAIISGSVYVKVNGKAILASGLVKRRAEESAPFRGSGNSRVEAKR